MSRSADQRIASVYIGPQDFGEFLWATTKLERHYTSKPSSTVSETCMDMVQYRGRRVPYYYCDYYHSIMGPRTLF